MERCSELGYGFSEQDFRVPSRPICRVYPVGLKTNRTNLQFALIIIRRIILKQNKFKTLSVCLSAFSLTKHSPMTTSRSQFYSCPVASRLVTPPVLFLGSSVNVLFSFFASAIMCLDTQICSEKMAVICHSISCGIMVHPIK